jgi:hypothetical protein
MPGISFPRVFKKSKLKRKERHIPELITENKTVLNNLTARQSL